MNIHDIFEDASRVMTVVSFLTFSGILAWTWLKKEQDFAASAALPFADEEREDSHD